MRAYPDVTKTMNQASNGFIQRVDAWSVDLQCLDVACNSGGVLALMHILARTICNH
jgi:hypothetical protein